MTRYWVATSCCGVVMGHISRLGTGHREAPGKKEIQCMIHAPREMESLLGHRPMNRKSW